MQTQTTARNGTELMDVRFASGEAYEVAVRGHRVLVDQPADAGGEVSAPTPTELFVASLATCVAYYAGRYLTRHGFTRLARRPHSSAQPSTMRHRSANACDDFERRDHRRSASRSSSDNTNGGFGRPRPAIPGTPGLIQRILGARHYGDISFLKTCTGGTLYPARGRG